MTAIFLRGDALSVLRKLPSGIVRTCITSPPYYGLRKYLAEDTIFGGDANCRHEWDSTDRWLHSGTTESPKLTAGVITSGKVLSGSCAKCGAWKGSLGLEPRVDDYIQHLIEILREVRRVLRDDGIVWFNLGESMASIGTNISDTVQGMIERQSICVGNGATITVASKCADVSLPDNGFPYGKLFSLLGVQRVVMKQRNNDFCQVFNTFGSPVYCRIGIPVCFAKSSDSDLEITFDSIDDIGIVISKHDLDSKPEFTVSGVVGAGARVNADTSFSIKQPTEPVPEVIRAVKTIGDAVSFDPLLKRFPDINFVNQAVAFCESSDSASRDVANFHVIHASPQQLSLSLGDSRVNITFRAVSQVYLHNIAGSFVSYRELYYKASRYASGVSPLNELSVPERLKLELVQDGWICRETVIWEKPNPLPCSVQGVRWEYHRVPQCPRCKSLSSIAKRVCKICGWKKPANRGIGVEVVGPNTGSENGEPYQLNNPHTVRLDEGEMWRAETGQQERDVSGGFRSDSFMVDCPGCAKCTPNGGLVLRTGSWRPTRAHEYIFMLTKTADYYSDGEAVKQPIADSTIGRGPVDFGGLKGRGYEPDGDDPNFRNGSEQWGRTFDYTESCIGGRNLRSVWEFPTSPLTLRICLSCLKVYSRREYLHLSGRKCTCGAKNWGSHYAAFPLALPTMAIKASIPEAGVCAKCGKPYARILGKKFTDHTGITGTGYDTEKMTAGRLALLRQAAREKGGEYINESKTLGWKSTCRHTVGTRRPLVLDPFAGTGTTAVAADRLGCDFIGIDISPEYIAIALDRFKREASPSSSDLLFDDGGHPLSASSEQILGKIGY